MLQTGKFWVAVTQQLITNTVTHHHSTILVSAIFWSLLNQAFYGSENAGNLFKRAIRISETSLCWLRFIFQSYGFSSSQGWMWELDHKEGWVLKNWFFWTVVVEKTLENPSDSKDIKSFDSEGNHPWIFIGRTDAEAVAPVLWPPDAKSQLTGKDPNAGKDWRQEEKGVKEDKMIGWHDQLNGHEFEQTLGDSEGQGSLACYSLWGHRVGCNLVAE